MSLSGFTSNALVDFGEAVTLDGAAVRALVGDDYAVHQLGDGGMSTSRTALTLKTADVPADPVGKAATVRGASYAVVEARPDGTAAGYTLLVLEASA